MKKVAILNILAVLLLGELSPVQSQYWIAANPADPYDCRTAFINPAIVAQQPGYIAVGTKLMHVGFLEQDRFGLRADYFSVTSPYLLDRGFVVGLAAQQFGVAMYRHSHLRFSTGYQWNDRLLLGVVGQLFHQAYQQDHFQLGDVNDPLFAAGFSATSFSAGIGVVYVPVSSLQIGIAWNNISRPNLSLTGSEARLPSRLDVGIAYQHDRWSAGIAWQNDGSVGLAGDYFIAKKGVIRLGLFENTLACEGRLNILNQFQIIYSYDYPMNEFDKLSVGSHQIGFVFAFSDGQRFIQHRKAPPLETTRLQLSSSTDTIAVERMQRELVVDRNLQEHSWEHVAGPVLPVFEQQKNSGIMVYSGGDMDSTEFLTETYQRTLQQIADVARQQGKPITVLATDTSMIPMAISRELAEVSKLRQIATGSMKKMSELTPARHIEYHVDPRVIEFRIQGRRGRARFWHLEIQDYEGKGIQWFDGIGRIPSRIRWKLDDATLTKLRAGFYYYQLTWSYDSDQVHRSERRRLTITFRSHSSKTVIRKRNAGFQKSDSTKPIQPAMQQRRQTNGGD